MICTLCNSDKLDFAFKVPFNKSCHGVDPKSTIKDSVDFYICKECGYIHAPYFISWGSDDFAKNVYNSDYVKFDPDFKLVRPQQQASTLIRSGWFNKQIKHLDYGCGNGKLVELLKTQGYKSIGYDPFYNENEISDTYDIITCFEVLEHTVNPKQLFYDINKASKKNTIIFFTTYRYDKVLGIKPISSLADWWYTGVRNGHISFYSNKTINYIANKYEYKVILLSETDAMFKKC